MRTETIETTTEKTAEAEVRAAIESWAAAVHARDVGRIMAHYAPDVVAFDAIAALQFKGTAAYEKHWKACFAMCSGPMTFEAHDLEVAASGDVAFGHYLCFCGGTNEKGEEQSGWMRATVCHRRVGGRWRIVHEHFSAPFDPPSGKALFDLKP
jgi:ketosteroid isomerase-like protein